MNKFIISLLSMLCIGIICSKSYAQTQEVYAKKGYTLVFINQDPDFDLELQDRMVKTFFDLYPKLSSRFNKEAVKEVLFIVDTAYTGVAETWEGKVKYSAHWLRIHPEDIDVVTHEIMHIVQNYPYRPEIWWVTEGIADFIRFKYGVDNSGSGWAMPYYRTEQSYKNGYRVTARFFVWIEKQHPGFIESLDIIMRNDEYDEKVWEKLTGKTVDQLWEIYSENPVI